MSTFVPTFVDVNGLFEQRDNAEVVPVDCRFALGRPNAGREAYAAGHIPGARYANLETDLSDPAARPGGRHPLPGLDRFARFLNDNGITAKTHVVAYDDLGDMAPRLWWLLRYVGWDRVSVLRGGVRAWTDAGLPQESGLSLPPGLPAGAAPITGAALRAAARVDWIAPYEEIYKRLAVGSGEDRPHLIDSRARIRYRGETEPIDPVAGHIPGAVCRPWDEALAAPAQWRDPAELRAFYGGALDGREVVVYCGSGVSACANILGLHDLGVHARLYPGSWSDWCTRPGSPMAVGDEEA